MSHIIEALKKAQKENEIKNIGFIRRFETSVNKKRALKFKTFYYVPVFLFLLIFLVFIGFSWLDLFPEKDSPETSDSVSASDQIPVEVQERVLLVKNAGELLQSGMKRDAELHYKKVLELDPGHVETLNDLGVMYLLKGNYESAASSLKKAIMLRPGYVKPYYNMACLYSFKGEPEKGIIYLKKAVELNEDVKQWAIDDSDLANMRMLPEFMEILKR